MKHQFGGKLLKDLGDRKFIRKLLTMNADKNPLLPTLERVGLT